ncbi:TPM domain-containing protein [Erythrobacter westpacificensis]|uniref:TPM domain-containing protein n=1 Tax=Erythrobacter westpacificensis TaxID=1055231 RepID=A0ABP9KMY7_9SPHN
MAYLSPEKHKLVSDAVGNAEATTSGEIVPVIAQRSDDYSDIALTWAAAIAFTAMSIFAAFPSPFLDFWDATVADWGHEWTTGELASMTIALGLIAFVGTWLLMLIPGLRIALTPAPVKAQRVRQRAIRHFKVGAEGRTHGRTGVLLYLSMQEHRAEIVADDPIAVKVDAEVWGEAMADMLDEIRKGCIAEGIAAGVRDVGVVLAQHFPRKDDDRNELPDRLIEL